MANSETPTFISGEKTVTTSGTAEALVAAKTMVKRVKIVPKTGNTNQVYVGGSTVATTTNDGLDADEAVTIESSRRFDLGLIFLDVDTDGEGVDFYVDKI